MVGKILLIDDDVKIGQLLTKYFSQFDIELCVAHKPSDGFAMIESLHPALLILDVMLPEMDGFEVCRQIRQQPERFGHLPIIMLTARGDVTDRIVGLELGADDYLPKPFEPRELIVRVQSVLRRSQLAISDDKQLSEKNISQLKTDCLTLDLVKQSVLLDKQTLDITSMEFALLKVFMQAPGKTFSRDELMSELRGIDAELYSRAIDTLVSRLRHRLNDVRKSPKFIKTVWGRGYVFVAKVSSIST